jgi:hypothetical protein
MPAPSEMEKRVARAIWDMRESRFPKRVRRDPDSFDIFSGAAAIVLEDARAAIAAMREPADLA